MEVKLGYGKKGVELLIPDGNLELVRPKEEMGRPAAYLDEVLDGGDIQKIVKGRSVCILPEDCTRDLPHEEIAGYICNRMEGSGKVTVILATGTHSPSDDGNRRIAGYYKNLLRGIKSEVLVHDCFNSKFRGIGRTTHGTEVLANEKVLGHDVYLTFSAMKPHYFAGYSNAYKNLVPGVCAYQTVEENHSLTMDDRSTYGMHPLNPNPERRDNPLAEDILEGCNMILEGKPAYSLSFICSNRSIFWAEFGRIYEATSRGIAEVDRRSAVRIKPADYVIVSPGGSPNDESLYIAQRALELTKKAYSDGAELLFLAECKKGMAHNRKAEENFHLPLKGDLEEILSMREEYRLYSHKPYRFAQLLKRLEAFHMHSSLDDRTVEGIHLKPAGDPQTVVDSWLEENPRARILVFDKANSLAVY
ncbi:MAG: lactate racemase domain-containing protein [Candidatus Altiarchaeota archaeon]